MLKFKQGDKCVVVRLETSVRQRTKKDPPGLGDWITERAKEVKRKAVIASLHNFYVGVRLAKNEIKHCLYVDLSFFKSGKVGFKTSLPNWKGVEKDSKGIYREVIKPGKLVTVRGNLILTGVHIPVLIDGKPYQVLYENLKFKETK